MLAPINAKHIIVSGFRSVVLRLWFVVMTLASVSACGAGPFWVNRQQFDAASDPPSKQSSVADPPLVVVRYRRSPAHEVHVYKVENEKLNRVYEKLTARMTLDEQLALSQEQTAWLNKRAISCTKAGVFNDWCGTKLTSERITELKARVDALPRVATTQAPVVAAHPGTYTVAATSMPWVWKAGGLNTAFQYGLQDGSPPTVVPLAGLSAQAGQRLTIRYVGGQIALGADGPKADGLGYAGQKDHGGNGITGKKLPSAFMQPYPINLGALVGVFTDKNGCIVGAPFAIGDGWVRERVPPGAQQLQLGVNDDIFGAENAETGNSGSFTVSVSSG